MTQSTYSENDIIKYKNGPDKGIGKITWIDKRHSPWRFEVQDIFTKKVHWFQYIHLKEIYNNYDNPEYFF